jgi:hypothetical protein
MNRPLFGALGVAAVLTLTVGNCKSDPFSDLDKTPTALVINFSHVQVPVGDAASVTASVLDGRATPLPVPVAFRMCNTGVGVATVAVDPSYHPVPATSSRVLVTAVTFGTTCVIAEAEGFTDTVTVATFPASVVVIGPDTVVSGVGATYTHEFRGRAGNPLSGVPAPTWTVGDTTRATVTAAGGVLSGRDTGFVNVTVTGIGTSAAGVVGTKPVVVLPAPFGITIVPNPADPGQVVNLSRAPTGPIFDANTSIRFGTSVQTFVTGTLTPDSVKVAIPDVAAGGVLGVGAARLGPDQITQSGGLFTVNTPAVLAGTVTPTSGIPGTAVTIKRGGGDPAFDANTRVFFDGIRTFVSVNTADSLVVPVPGIGSTGAKELRMTRLDAGDLARRGTFTSNSATLADQYDAVNNDPATAPVITANGDYFVVVSGACVNGVGGAGTDCDDFFKVTNSGGAPATITVNVAWLTGPDIDAYGLDPTFDFCTYDDGCAAATGANPEQFEMTIPAGETWFIYINLWAPAGTTSTAARVRVSGLP